MSEKDVSWKLCFAKARFYFRLTKEKSPICRGFMHCILQHSFVTGMPEEPHCSSSLSTSLTSASELETSSLSMLCMMASLDLAAT
jgi:hypothetical protein